VLQKNNAVGGLRAANKINKKFCFIPSINPLQLFFCGAPYFFGLKK
jgi:hypothetical protein